MITENALLISSRFCGPPRSGNGGYVAGSLVEALLGREGYGQAVSVTLRLPLPLDTALPLTREADSVTVKNSDGAVMVEAKLTESLPAAPAAVDAHTADAATLEYQGRDENLFSCCFVCGVSRKPGDGLRLFAGPVTDRKNIVATVWRPSADFSEAALNPDFSGSPNVIPARVVCAALDCPGAWAANFDPAQPIVLGRMNTVIHTPLTIGKEYVVIGESREQRGRRRIIATAVYDTTGQLLAAAGSIWFSVDPSTFAGLVTSGAE